VAATNGMGLTTDIQRRYNDYLSGDSRVASANHASVLIISCWASHCHFDIFLNCENKDLLFATTRMQHGSTDLQPGLHQLA
jgi:hypothetical protein